MLLFNEPWPPVTKWAGLCTKGRYARLQMVNRKLTVGEALIAKAADEAAIVLEVCIRYTERVYYKQMNTSPQSVELGRLQIDIDIHG